MLLEAGKTKEALAAFELTMKKEPNRYRGIAGAARAAEKLGDNEGGRVLQEAARRREGRRHRTPRARAGEKTDAVGAGC